MRYKVKTKIAGLEFKKRIVGFHQTGEIDQQGKPIYLSEEEGLGWYVTFEGSRESLFIGWEKPEGIVGSPATITLEW